MNSGPTKKRKTRSTTREYSSTIELAKIAAPKANGSQHEATIKQLELDLQQSRKQNLGLKAEVAELEDKIQLQAPLVEIAVAIRRRFFETAKETRGYGAACVDILAAGERVAASGNVRADMAMFQLGYMKSAARNPIEIQGQSDFEPGYKDTLFKEFYTYFFDDLLPVSKDNFRLFSRKMLEICDMSATLAAHTGYSVVGFNRDADLEKFKRLAVECLGEDNRISGLFPIHEYRYQAFDSWPTVDTRVREMRSIVERVVQRINRQPTADHAPTALEPESPDCVSQPAV